MTDRMATEPARGHGLVPHRPMRRTAVTSWAAVPSFAIDTAGSAGERMTTWVILAAILSQMTVSANLLLMVGIAYDTPGGLPFEKFHLGTYLALLAVVLQVRRERPIMRHLIRRVAAAPYFATALALMIVCAIYTLLSTGLSGSAVYIESYASAALLGMALERQSPEALRLIAYAMLLAFVLNALVCIGETATQHLLVPMWMTNPDGFVSELPSFAGEFRGTGLAVNPLAGATMSMMGVLLCLASDVQPVRKIFCLLVLLISLIAFGGRTAMLVTYAIVAVVVIWASVVHLARRRVGGIGLMLAMAAMVVVPALLTYVLFATPLGARISGKLYVDDSATVRVVQWLIFERMDWRDWLFGVGPERLLVLMVQIGLDPPLNDIENFWLLVFVSLGIVGFAIWLTGFAVLLLRLWMTPGKFGRILLLAVLAVASSNNSLGRKSNILFICVAAVMTSTAFATPIASASRVRRRVARPYTIDAEPETS